MKTKSIVVNFIDGSKEIFIGDDVYVSSKNNNYNAIVTKIGNRYIKICEIFSDGRQSYREVDFLILDGTEKTEYVPNYLYSCKAGYDLYKMQNDYINSIKRIISSYGLKLDYQQALKITEILNIEGLK